MLSLLFSVSWPIFSVWPVFSSFGIALETTVQEYLQRRHPLDAGNRTVQLAVVFLPLRCDLFLFWIHLCDLWDLEGGETKKILS